MTVVTTRALRRHRGAVLIAVLLVALVATSIGWWAASRRDRVQVGDHFQDVTIYSDQLPEHDAFVELPFGTMSLSIGVGPEAGDRSRRVKAPAGSALVEVSWSAMSTTPPPVWPTATAAQRRDPGTDLTLLTGGRRYPLAKAVTMADENSSVLVVVRGDGTDAKVEARFGGRVSLSRTGKLQPPVIRSDGFRACEDKGGKVFSWVHCTVRVYRGDFVPGLGAAPTGKEWLVVHDSSVTRSEQHVTVYAANGDGGRYLPSGAPTVTVGLDGSTSKPRVAGSDVPVGDAVRVAARAWLVPAEMTATLRLRYRLPTTLDRTQSWWHDAPPTHETDVGTTVTYPGGSSAS